MSGRLVLDHKGLIERIEAERERRIGFDENPSVEQVLSRVDEADLIVISECLINGIVGGWDISRVEDRLHDMRTEVVESVEKRVKRIERE